MSNLNKIFFLILIFFYKNVLEAAENVSSRAIWDEGLIYHNDYVYKRIKIANIIKMRYGFDYWFDKKFSMTGIAPFFSTNNLKTCISETGIGDPTLSLNYKFYDKNSTKLIISGGGSIPTASFCSSGHLSKAVPGFGFSFLALYNPKKIFFYSRMSYDFFIKKKCVERGSEFNLTNFIGYTKKKDNYTINTLFEFWFNYIKADKCRLNPLPENCNLICDPRNITLLIGPSLFIETKKMTAQFLFLFPAFSITDKDLRTKAVIALYMTIHL